MLSNGCKRMLWEQHSHHFGLNQLNHHATTVEVGKTAQSAGSRIQNATIVARGPQKESVPQLFKEEGQTPTKEQTNLLESGEPGSDDSDTETYHLHMLPSKASIPIDLNISLKDAKTTMEPDAGVSRSIISESTDQKLWNANPPVIKCSPTNIQICTGQRLGILRKITGEAYISL